MNYRERKKSLPVVGAWLSDVSIRYVELVPHNGDYWTPASWGVVNIPFDVLESGKILQQTVLTEACKKLRKEVSTSEVVFSSVGNSEQDNKWAETFRVAGFSKARHMNVEDAVASYYNTDLEEDFQALYLSDSGVTSFVYDSSVGQSMLTQSSTVGEASLVTSRVALCGDLSLLDESWVSELRDTGKEQYSLNVWRHCFSFEDYIPELPQRESLMYAPSVALAYLGSRFWVEKNEVSTEVAKKVVIQEERIVVPHLGEPLGKPTDEKKEVVKEEAEEKRPQENKKPATDKKDKKKASWWHLDADSWLAPVFHRAEKKEKEAPAPKKSNKKKDKKKPLKKKKK